jgi:hypothetical protein
MVQLKRIGGMTLAMLGLTLAALTVGAYSGGAAEPPKPAPTSSLVAVNCTAPPPGVATADWCPGN